MKNKTIVITGASSGIGAATARILSAAGARLILAARRGEKLTQLAEDLPGETLIKVVDITVPGQVHQLMDEGAERWGGIDVLINNAGVGHLGPIKDALLSEWHEMINVNVNGLLTCMHVALPHLLKSKGHIINIASVSAHAVFPGSVVYCASKHAVNAITVGFRMEFRDKIKITNISPGVVRTEFVNHIRHEEARRGFEQYYEGVVLEPEDVANAILNVLQQPQHVVVNEMIIRPNR